MMCRGEPVCDVGGPCVTSGDPCVMSGAHVHDIGRPPCVTSAGPQCVTLVGPRA